MSDTTAPEGAPTKRVLLGDGTSGLRAWAFPRARLHEALPTIRGAGVYILLGGQGCPDADVAKARRLRGRFRQHDTNQRREYWDRALVFVTPPGVMDGRGDPRLAWLEEQVHGLVAPNGRRALRVRNRAHFPPRTPLGEDDLRTGQEVLQDVEAIGVRGRGAARRGAAIPKPQGAMRIVVVSLARATQRRARMVERQEALGLDYDIHDATDWRDLTPSRRRRRARACGATGSTTTWAGSRPHSASAPCWPPR